MRLCDYKKILEIGERENNPHFPLAKEYVKYLEDPSVYPIVAKTPSSKINQSGLTKDEERLIADKWRFIDEKDVHCSVYTFKVAEYHKDRSRTVHSCHINNACKERDSTNQPPPFTMKSNDEINSILVAAEFVIQFDSRAMYDQFPLEKGVSGYFVFRERGGRLVALTRLPMGFCYACGVAQGLSLILVTFPCENRYYKITTVVHLDNYLFAFTRKVGDEPPANTLKEYVVQTMSTFLHRTHLVDLQSTIELPHVSGFI